MGSKSVFVSDWVELILTKQGGGRRRLSKRGLVEDGGGANVRQKGSVLKLIGFFTFLRFISQDLCSTVHFLIIFLGWPFTLSEATISYQA